MNKLKEYIKFFKFRPVYYFVAINLFFIMLSALLSAKIVNVFIGKALREPPRVERAVVGGDDQIDKLFAKIPDINLAMEIAELNIFGSAREPEVALPPSDGEIEDYMPEDETVPASTIDCPATTLRAQLAGTLYAPDFPALHGATITDLGTQEPKLYHIGDKVMGEAEILEIDIDRVVLKHQGVRSCLYMGGGSEAATKQRGGGTSDSIVSIEYIDPKKAPKGKPSSGEIKKISSSKYAISRDVLSYLSNLGAQEKNIKLIPNFVGGRPQGFRVAYIKQESLISELGIAEGDVILKAGEKDLNSENDALTALTELRNANEITIAFKRNNEDQTYTYEIR